MNTAQSSVFELSLKAQAMDWVVLLRSSLVHDLAQL